MANTENTLRKTLRRIDGKGYGAYKSLKGSYDLGDFRLHVRHVQADPFAPPSIMAVTKSFATMGWPPTVLENEASLKAFEDKLALAFHAAAVEETGPAPEGRRVVSISCNGQEVLKRNAVVAGPEDVEIRFAVRLPARGRTIRGAEAERLLLTVVPRIVARSLVEGQAVSADEMRRHIESLEDQAALRRWVVDSGLVGFIADGSILPRRSGIDQRPLSESPAGSPRISFRSPDTLATTVRLPHRGEVRGMGIPRGVTLIVGGGFHGKSTLLEALSRGVYDHRPGDGRELVATDPTAMKIRAEDGRAIASVDLSPLIGTLPFGRETTSFSTQNASGSTSQAAGIMEALEAGARVLLMDEDTCATNMMIRDERMRRLVADDREPITPFVDRVRRLYEEHGVSTILVMGGTGDYFGVADTVIMMDSYEARDVTPIARALGTPGQDSARVISRPFSLPAGRRPVPASLNAARGRRSVAIDAKGTGMIRYGEELIDVSGVEQLVDPGQTGAVGPWIERFGSRSDATMTILEGLRAVGRDVAEKGLDVLDRRGAGRLAQPRILEVAAALNRLRCLRIQD